MIKQGVAIALDRLSAMLARLDEPDQATLGLIHTFLEQGVEKLAEVKALNNADSFVALVLDDVLEQAKVFSFRPERP